MTRLPTSPTTPTGGDVAIEAVVFDMGGVLVRLGPLPELLGTSGPEDDFWTQWLTSPSVRRFERGDCDVDEFAHGVVDDLELSISPDRFVANFARFPQGLFPGAAELVAELPSHVVTAILSNTNALHWDTQPDAGIIQGLCSHCYLSYRLGVVKPDAAIFEHMVEDLEVPARRILFIDDNELNVAGARQTGLLAEVARGVDQTRSVLAAYALLD